MRSIWQDRTEYVPHSPLMRGDTVDVAIIGGGLVGILTALKLRKSGVDTVVLEAAEVGSGQSGRSTGKLTSQHGLKYTTLVKRFGTETARLYAEANQSAIDEYESLIAELGLECGFRRLPSYLYTNQNDSALLEEACAARIAGIASQFVHNAELPFSVKAALRFNEQAQFDPYRFVTAASKELRVYENTPVLRVNGTVCETPKASIRAKRVIFATNFPFMNSHGMFYARLHRQKAYVLAVSGTIPLSGIYFGIDDDGLSLRSCFDDVTLICGGSHRTGENPTGGKYEMLRNAARQYFPASTEIAHWSAEDCVTLDGVPYIGFYGNMTPGWYTATGFAKWGMTTSMAAARVLSDLVVRGSSPYYRLFTPQRFPMGVAAKPLGAQVKHAVQGIGRRVFSPAEGSFESLPVGCGGIVEYDAGDGAEKLGVYKSPDGKVYVVTPQCPHMGCQLSWNPDDLSWECPCHGSRFDYTGKLIDNPAQTDIDLQADGDG